MASGSNIPSSILSVATKNYLTDGDGGGTIYKRVSAQPSHLGSFRSQDRFLPNGSTDATNGGWWEIVGSDLTPSQFGAKVDGTTDDAAALQACCNAVIAKGGGRVRLPAGTMRIKSTISLSVSTTLNLMIQGAGMFVSVLSFSDAATDGISFTSTVTTANQHPNLQLTEFACETSKQNSGTAIIATWANSFNISRPFTMDKVNLRQCISRVSDSGTNYGYWNRGIYLSNARNSSIANSYVQGELNLSPGTSVGVELANECTYFSFYNNLVSECTTGYYLGGTSEGQKFDACSTVYCRYGIQIRRSTGADPELSVVNCDFNCANIGIWIESIQMVSITGCTFYASAGLDSGTWPSWTGVLIQGTLARYISITGCKFSKEARTGDTTVCIDANGSGGSCLAVSACQFYGFSGNPVTYGVFARSGFTRCDVDEMCQFENVTTPFSNAGALSQRSCKTIGGSATVATSTSITFPNAFYESCQSVIAVHDGTNTAVNVTVGSITTSGFTVYHNAGSSVAIRWVAMGY
jgi:hypothetical protein